MNAKDNLKEAFAGESQANQKYRAFAKKAEQEGFSNVARLFRTTAEAERIHAEGHLKSLAEIGSALQRTSKLPSRAKPTRTRRCTRTCSNRPRLRPIAPD